MYFVLAYIFFVHSVEILLVLRDLLDEDNEKQAVVLMFNEKLYEFGYVMLFGLIVSLSAGITYAFNLSRGTSFVTDSNRTLVILYLVFRIIDGIIKFGFVFAVLYCFSIFLFIQNLGWFAGGVFAIVMGTVLCFSFHSNRLFPNKDTSD